MQIEALPSDQQHQAVDTIVKWLRTDKPRQHLVAVNTELVFIMIHHAQDKICFDLKVINIFNMKNNDLS